MDEDDAKTTKTNQVMCHVFDAVTTRQVTLVGIDNVANPYRHHRPLLQAIAVISNLKRCHRICYGLDFVESS